MSEPLTKRQQRVLDFLIRQIRIKGYPPTVREIAADLGISGPKGAKKFLDILERKGYIRRISGSSRAIEILHPAVPQTCMVPVIGRIMAGSPILAVENMEGEIAVDTSLARGKDLFFLRVEGDSMIEAHIQEGDYALIRPQPCAENGDIVAVLIGEDVTLKRFYKDEFQIRLEPANSNIRPIILTPEDQAVILGRLIGIYRSYESPVSLRLTMRAENPRRGFSD
ncbi:transcriptional repressor LexA [bacterium]|nr:transcriptional repressor LexA [bacterium]